MFGNKPHLDVAGDYPSNWDSKRKSVYKRDDYTCQNCGARGGSLGDAQLEAHHIVPKSSGGSDKKSNLKTLCSQCHKAVHGNRTAPTGRIRDTNTGSSAKTSGGNHQEEKSLLELMEEYNKSQK